MGVELYYVDASWYKGSSKKGDGDWGCGLGTALGVRGDEGGPAGGAGVERLNGELQVLQATGGEATIPENMAYQPWVNGSGP